MDALAKANLIDRLRRLVVAQNPERGWVIDNLVFLHVGGSTLYGTSTADSDLDVRGVTIAPKSFWVGARSFEQLECSIPEQNVEVVIFDVPKVAAPCGGRQPQCGRDPVRR